MKHRTRLAASVAAALALGLGVTACGSDDEGSDSATEETASAEEVTVTTSDTSDGFTWDVSATPTAETKSVTFANDSEEPHALIFARLGEDYTVDEAYELQGRKGSAESIIEGDAQPGEERTFQVEKPIEPGEYVMLCPIPGKDDPHYKLGQLEEFEIQ